MSAYRQVFAIAAGDAVVVAGCATLAWLLKWWSDPMLSLITYVQAMPALVVGMTASYAGLGLYPGLGWGAADELRRLTQGTTLVFLAAIALTFLSKAGDGWSRQIFLVAWLLAVVAVPLMRTAMRRLCCRQSWWGIPCVVLGAGATGQRIISLLTARPWLGLRPVAVLDDDVTKHGVDFVGLPVRGAIAEHVPVLAQEGVRHAVLAMPGLAPARLSQVIDVLGAHLRHIFIAPALPGAPDLIATAREFANTMVLEVRQNLLRVEIRVLKRVLDVISVLIGTLLFWWLFLGLALTVKLSSPGPVFYGQRRIGRDGHSFTAWKFRSMAKDADVLLQHYLAEHPELREEWERDHKLRDDPRVTWVGRILRRTSLDELPQLWNVLSGEMSLVGPRPIVESEVAKYGERFPLYTKVRPGLSGLWQVSGRNDTTYAERVALDCYYVRNWSVWLDLVILTRTVRVVLWGKGAY
jgi:Undecaprenyl-phosphate galactose phosphotransferase WbaP